MLLYIVFDFVKENMELCSCDSSGVMAQDTHRLVYSI
jgi:hypothetical protein